MAIVCSSVEFTADIIEHRVREVTRGVRFSVTLCTPGHLEKLGESDWMHLEPYGFPVHLFSENDNRGGRKPTSHGASLTVATSSTCQEVPW